MFIHCCSINQFHKFHNAPVPYPTMLHSEQQCAHFCSEWSIVGYGTDPFLELWIRSTDNKYTMVYTQTNAITCTKPFIHTWFIQAWKSHGVSILPSKVMEFHVGLKKWHFAWKSHWKSMKVIEKYQFEEVGYFSYMIIVRLLTDL